MSASPYHSSIAARDGKKGVCCTDAQFLLPLQWPSPIRPLSRAAGNNQLGSAVSPGGIQQYMEAFPDGGFFVGKNFVFDERVTVAGGSQQVVGACCLCAAPYDAYEPRSRCSHCRMLVLVCPACALQVPLPNSLMHPCCSCALCVICLLT